MTLQEQLDTTYNDLVEAAQKLDNGETNPVLSEETTLEDFDVEVDIDSLEVVYTYGGPTIYAAFDADSCEGTLIAEHGDDHVEKELDSDVAATLIDYYFN